MAGELGSGGASGAGAAPAAGSPACTSALRHRCCSVGKRTGALLCTLRTATGARACQLDRLSFKAGGLAPLWRADSRSSSGLRTAKGEGVPAGAAQPPRHPCPPPPLRLPSHRRLPPAMPVLQHGFQASQAGAGGHPAGGGDERRRLQLRLAATAGAAERGRGGGGPAAPAAAQHQPVAAQHRRRRHAGDGVCPQEAG